MTDVTTQACELYRKLHAQSPNIVALSDDGLVGIVGGEIYCIEAALAARERAVWLEAADMVDCVELLDPSGLTKKEQLRIYDIIFKIAEMCRQKAEEVKP